MDCNVTNTYLIGHVLFTFCLHVVRHPTLNHVTFDFFNERVLGKKHRLRRDFDRFVARGTNKQCNIASEGKSIVEILIFISHRRS